MLTNLQTIQLSQARQARKKADAAAKPCAFCSKHLSHYTCPRCSAAFCSVECYRSDQHSECVRTAEDNGKGKMKEVLGKYGFEAPADGSALRFVEGEEPVYEWGEDEESTSPAEGDETTAKDNQEEEEHEEEEEDEEAKQWREDLRKRMEGVDIENADFDDLWERLDSREREEFVKLAKEFEERGSQPSLMDDE